MIRTATFAILAGIVILHYLPHLPPAWLLIMGPVLIPLLFVNKNRAIKFLLLGAVGFMWAHFQAYTLLKHRLPEDFINKDVTVIGHIASLPQKDHRKIRFEFDIEKTIGSDLDIAPTKIRLTWYQNNGQTQALHVGDKWQFTVRLKPPRNFANPGSFNYSGWLLQKKILSIGYVRGKSGSYLIESNPFSYPVQRVREKLRHDLTTSTLDKQVEPFIRALIIGDRADLKTKDWIVLKNTGTVHLMAISGLHVGLIAGFVFFFARLCWSLLPFLTLKFAAPRAAALIALAAAVAYAALAGFSLPTQRALIMLSIILLAIVFKRTLRPSVVLSLALLVVLIFDSFAVLAISFWLSFGAVGLIYYFIYTQQRGQHKLKKWLLLQLLISLGLLPLTIHFFQQASLISPLANLFAIPVVGFIIVPICFLGAALLLIYPPLGTFLLSVAEKIFRLLWDALEWLALLPVSNITLSPPGLMGLILACVGCLLLFLPKAFRLRLVAPIFFVPLFFPFQHVIEYSQVEVTVLDVGQGLAAVIQTKQHTMVFDTGPRFSRNFDTGRAVLLPFLNDKGIRKLDMLMVSHGDNDHIGGANSILSAMPVKTLITSVPDMMTSQKAHRCERGQRWEWDGVTVEVLHPDANDYDLGYSENNLSCVLKITSQQQSFLFTADIEQQAESILLERYNQKLSSDILIAPHHGSKSSSTWAFIHAVNPTTVIIPAGWRNRYRFPHDVVLERYARLKSRVLNTAEQGAITIQTKPVEISSFRNQNANYWDR